MWKFQDVAIPRGSIFWFRPTDAIRVIAEARAQRVSILGIDGAFLHGMITQPSLSDSIDFSTMTTPPDDVYVAAISFIQRRSNMDIHFEVVLGPVPESSESRYLTDGQK